MTNVWGKYAARRAFCTTPPPFCRIGPPPAPDKYPAGPQAKFYTRGAPPNPAPPNSTLDWLPGPTSLTQTLVSSVEFGLRPPPPEGFYASSLLL